MGNQNEDHEHAVRIELINLHIELEFEKNALANYLKLKSHIKAFKERIEAQELNDDIVGAKISKALAYDFYYLKDRFEEIIQGKNRKS